MLSYIIIIVYIGIFNVILLLLLKEKILLKQNLINNIFCYKYIKYTEIYKKFLYFIIVIKNITYLTVWTVKYKYVFLHLQKKTSIN